MLGFFGVTVGWCGTGRVFHWAFIAPEYLVGNVFTDMFIFLPDRNILAAWGENSSVSFLLEPLSGSWLSSIVDWNTDENARLVWSDFKEPFKQEYAVQTNDKLILDGLSNLAMKPNETTNELLTRITRTTRVIRESFDEYDAKIPYINLFVSNPNGKHDPVMLRAMHDSGCAKSVMRKEIFQSIPGYKEIPVNELKNVFVIS